MSYVVVERSKSPNPAAMPCVECGGVVPARQGRWWLVRFDGEVRNRWRAAHERCPGVACEWDDCAGAHCGRPYAPRQAAPVRQVATAASDPALASLRREVRALWVVAALALVLAGTQAASAAAAVLVKLLEALRS